jgi:hypothetical protein
MKQDEGWSKSRARSEHCRFIRVGIVLATYRVRTEIDRVAEKKHQAQNDVISRTKHHNGKSRKTRAEHSTSEWRLNFVQSKNDFVASGACHGQQKFSPLSGQKNWEKVWCLVLWLRFRVIVWVCLN